MIHNLRHYLKHYLKNCIRLTKFITKGIFGTFILLSSSLSFSNTALPVQIKSPSSILIEVLVGLLIVVFLILIAAKLLGRLGLKNMFPDKCMRVISSMPLGTREKAVLINVGEKVILLGVAPGRVSTLHVFDNDPQSEFEQHSAVSEPLNESVTEKNADGSSLQRCLSKQNVANDDSPKQLDFSKYIKAIMTNGIQK